MKGSASQAGAIITETKVNVTRGGKQSSIMRPICLKPSSTTYAAFLQRTKEAMGSQMKHSSKSKPSELVLSLGKSIA